jgi:hypothetical protein
MLLETVIEMESMIVLGITLTVLKTKASPSMSYI